MPLNLIAENDKILHIHSHEKEMTETTVKSITIFDWTFENGVIFNSFNDTMVKLDDPLLAKAKLDYQRYLCVKTMAFGSRERFSEDVLNKIDELYAMLSTEEKEKTISTLSACGALQKEPSFLAKKLNK
jgi:hypothetical protein